MSQKDASDATRAVLEGVLTQLPFEDTTDFDDARRGLIAPLPDGGVITNEAGGAVWDVGQYDWVNQGDCPDTVHPSLHRQTQLLTFHGLFEVCERVYQVRSADLANMTIIEGDTGVVLVDPLTAPETARAALDLYRSHRGDRPVVAVIHTHSHVDHFGGVKGVTTEADVAAGRTQIIAPVGFAEAALSENVMAGNVMIRRASYMYGPLLPKGPKGTVSPGLGLGIPLAGSTFIVPTIEIVDDGAGDDDRRRRVRLHAGARHRGARGDAVPPAAVPGAVLGRGRDPRAAQPLHVARRPHPRREGLGVLPEPGDRPVRRRTPTSSSRSTTGPRGVRSA